mmetsp:Transcript_5239/g.19613  ORF Transcript_5239/g.19613 Transcript_5239/m.19613 type:complete len:293 (-) Transcript_5239:51-929(-)
MAIFRGPARRAHSRRSFSSFSRVGRCASTSSTPPQISTANSKHISSTVFTTASRVSVFCARYALVFGVSVSLGPASAKAAEYDAALSRYFNRAATLECASFIRSNRSLALVGTNGVTRCVGRTPSSFCNRANSLSRLPCPKLSRGTSGKRNGEPSFSRSSRFVSSPTACHGSFSMTRGRITCVGLNASCAASRAFFCVTDCVFLPRQFLGRRRCAFLLSSPRRRLREFGVGRNIFRRRIGIVVVGGLRSPPRDLNRTRITGHPRVFRLVPSSLLQGQIVYAFVFAQPVALPQ